jgi:hypothetical protein
MRLTDKTLTCSDCDGDFVFTAAEQELLLIRGRNEEPRRCPRCFRRAGQRHGRREVPSVYVTSMIEP